MTDEELIERIKVHGEAATQADLLFTVAKAMMAATPEEKPVLVHAGDAYIDIYLADTPCKYSGLLKVRGHEVATTKYYPSREKVWDSLLTSFYLEQNNEFNKLESVIRDNEKARQKPAENIVDRARSRPCEWVFGSKNEGMLVISIELDWCKGPYEVVRMRGKLKHGFLVREFSTLKELQAILADYTGTEFKAMVSLPAIVGELRMKAELITGHAFPSYCRDGFLNALVFTENADV